ncbi:dihydrofolate reductase [Geomonas sp. RF6]|uniref:dihydrofolate reductase n=1 Tax=Geomonas sp. RF6 TaxID=2897342 RepID=UPI001E37E1A0|nr:dihydrofolate reductase [Geomonas sp. RF6]UFS68849.1 dihydrofolate reductase [Geomonas sp. RF6]
MIVSMIAAVAENGVIGGHGELPWHIPAELARFREITLGHTVVMGRKTFESIGRPLPGRRTIVLSRSAPPPPEGYHLARTLKEALELAQGEEELFICGGEEVFREAMQIAQRIYLTRVHGSFEGDVRFPEIPESFVEVAREEIPGASPSCTLIHYEKVEPAEPSVAAKEFQQKGVVALQRGLFHLARRCLEQAMSLNETAETASHLALSIAKSCRDFPRALRLAEEAVSREPENLEHYLNLGRVQILAGAKEQGLSTLRSGVQHGGGPEFFAELEQYGKRRVPPIRSLPRSHPLNKFLGRILARMGLR